jgi:hypothetical protein
MERALDRSLADIEIENTQNNATAALRSNKFMLHLWEIIVAAAAIALITLTLQPSPKLFLPNDLVRLSTICFAQL